MTDTSGRESTLLGRLFTRMGNPLDWSQTDKCLLVTLILLTFSIWNAVAVAFLFRHPDVAPYVNRPVLEVIFQIQVWIFIGGWTVLALVALAIRWRWPNGQFLVYVTLQFYSLTCALASYVIGHHTSLFGGITLVGGTTVGLLLFEKRPVLFGVASFVVAVTASTVAEQARLIPYAPALQGSPFEGGQLAFSWLFNVGGVIFILLMAIVSLIYYGFDRLRAQEVKLAQITDQLTRANELVSRYVAAQVAEQIRLGNYGAIDQQHRRRLTLFFSDIKGFSEVADRIEPEELSQILNEYFAEMTAIADRYGATVDKFMGDAMMIFFGAPMVTHDRDHALRAVRMALEMQVRIRQLHTKWQRDGIEEPFEVRIGINTGVASVGNFGAHGRMDYTAIGRQVNLAARLQVNCDPGKVLISHATWMLVQDEIACLPKGEIQVKGIHHPVTVYEVGEDLRAGEHPF